MTSAEFSHAEGNVYVSYLLLSDPPTAGSLCLLVPRWVDDPSGGGQQKVRVAERGHTVVCEAAPPSALFPVEYRTGVMLVGVSVEDFFTRSPVTDELPEQVDLAIEIDHQLHKLLSCITHGSPATR